MNWLWILIPGLIMIVIFYHPAEELHLYDYLSYLQKLHRWSRDRQRGGRPPSGRQH